MDTERTGRAGRMKTFLKCVLIGFVLNLFLVPLRLLGGEIYYVILISFPLFLLSSYWTFRRYETSPSGSWIVLSGLLIGLAVACIEPIIISIRFQLQIYFLPHVFIRGIGILGGFALWKERSRTRIVPALAGFAITLFMFFGGDALWLHYATYGNFTGRVAPQRIELFVVDGVDQVGVRITNQTLENKTVLLNFWNTRCGWCFQEFPSLQTFYETHKDNPSVGMFAVDKPLEEDEIGQAFKMIKEEGYDFPVLLPFDQELPEKVGVSGYPTTLVLDGAGNLIYRGDLKGAIALVDSQLQ
ncbi:MAG: TlpA disulfide reductase family protein [Pyrinomonadaceae bacterium]